MRKASPEAKAPEHWTLHDLRRTATTGMARLGQPVHVVEAVLNHKSGSIKGVAAVYNRYSYADEKRAALQAWGRYVTKLVGAGRTTWPSSPRPGSPKPGSDGAGAWFRATGKKRDPCAVRPWRDREDRATPRYSVAARFFSARASVENFLVRRKRRRGYPARPALIRKRLTAIRNACDSLLREIAWTLFCRSTQAQFSLVLGSFADFSRGVLSR